MLALLLLLLIIIDFSLVLLVVAVIFIKIVFYYFIVVAGVGFVLPSFNNKSLSLAFSNVVLIFKLKWSSTPAIVPEETNIDP